MYFSRILPVSMLGFTAVLKGPSRADPMKRTSPNFRWSFPARFYHVKAFKIETFELRKGQKIYRYPWIFYFLGPWVLVYFSRILPVSMLGFIAVLKGPSRADPMKRTSPNFRWIFPARFYSLKTFKMETFWAAEGSFPTRSIAIREFSTFWVLGCLCTFLASSQYPC